jgi:hypothetical protein
MQAVRVVLTCVLTFFGFTGHYPTGTSLEQLPGETAKAASRELMRVLLSRDQSTNVTPELGLRNPGNFRSRILDAVRANTFTTTQPVSFDKGPGPTHLRVNAHVVSL